MPNRLLPEVSFTHDGPVCDHVVTCRHEPHTIRGHDKMQYVQNIITNEAGLKSHLEKTGLIVSSKDRPVDAPNFLHRPGCLPRLCDYIFVAAHLHWSWGKKESGRCHQEAFWRRWEVSLQWPAHDRHGLGDVRRLRSRDAHHDPQDRHLPRRQAQPTPRTDHLPDQSTPFRHASTWCWGIADCMRMH